MLIHYSIDLLYLIYRPFGITFPILQKLTREKTYLQEELYGHFKWQS